MSQRATARYGMAALAMPGHTSAYAATGSSSGLLPDELEPIATPQGQANRQAMPSDVLDKLLVIYFTHVHVSVVLHRNCTADRVEPLAHHLQASLYSCNYPNTAA
jgi:hypothetical protein